MRALTVILINLGGLLIIIGLFTNKDKSKVAHKFSKTQIRYIVCGAIMLFIGILMKIFKIY